MDELENVLSALWDFMYAESKAYYDEKAIFALSIIFVAAAFGMMAIYDYPIVRYSLIAIGLVICLVKRKQIIDKFKMIKER